MFITSTFPNRGFIVQTRGGRKVAKLNLGRMDGIEIGQPFLLRATSVTAGLNVRVDYGEEIIGESKVVFVEEEFSWLETKGEYADSLIPGLAAFMYVEP